MKHTVGDTDICKHCWDWIALEDDGWRHEFENDHFFESREHTPEPPYAT